MLKRRLESVLRKSLSSGKSVFLLGPRQTGKSTLAVQLKPDLSFNLANESLFLEFARDSNFLESEIRRNLGTRASVSVLIDEVQRQPRLLNTIQDLVDSRAGLRFILTGSSARKLRRGKANLLPGRVHSFELGPIVASEMNYKMVTDQVLIWGCLPEVVSSSHDVNTKRLLKSYAMTYLNEEIKAEALTKNFEGFTRFLFRVAADASKVLDLSKISSAVGVPRQTVQRYFEILEDTLIVKRCEAYAKSEKRRFVQHPRFFLFDNGVLNSLLQNFQISADRRGFLFENFFYMQLSTSLSYSDRDYRISHYRTDAGAEVDFILELDSEVYALELKSGSFSQRDLGGFESLERWLGKKVKSFVIIPEGRPRLVGKVEVLPWQKFLEGLGV